MGRFTTTEGEIAGLRIIEPAVYADGRGYFMETYSKRDFADTGLDFSFIQDNQSHSVKGVLRGLHYQKRHPQAKLVRVLAGEIFDVAVDIRMGSPTFGKWQGILLSAANRKQFFIPGGFAHGFAVLSEAADVLYKCNEYYHPEDEAGIIWNDPTLGIKWPVDAIETLIISEKDQNLPPFKKVF